MISSSNVLLQGLNELFDFKLKYPEAEIETFLKKCSPFFQNYVVRGLQNIERERESKSSGNLGKLQTPWMIFL